MVRITQLLLFIIYNLISFATDTGSSSTDPFVRLTSVDAKWDENNTELTLSDINFHVPAGNFAAIIGPVGAGKSRYKS